MILPPYLNPGDTIGIAASARKVSPDELRAATHFLHGAGYKTVLASNIYKEENQFSGTDAERAEGINQFIHNPLVKAIWHARGGYGSVRLIDKIDWATLAKNPKWLCGFSDVTALHAHLHQKGIASLHSEMLLGFEKNTLETHQSFLNALSGKENKYHFAARNLNRMGAATGEIVGGNLSVLHSILGSGSQLKTDGKILFIEDLDEYLYHIDRMMMALKRAGMLQNIKALIVGGMSDMNDNAIPFGKTAEEIILDTVSEYDFPVCFNFPAGHLSENCAIKFGTEASLDIGTDVVFYQI